MQDSSFAEWRYVVGKHEWQEFVYVSWVMFCK